MKQMELAEMLYNKYQLSRSPNKVATEFKNLEERSKEAWLAVADAAVTLIVPTLDQQEMFLLMVKGMMVRAVDTGEITQAQTKIMSADMKVTKIARIVIMPEEMKQQWPEGLGMPTGD